MSYQIQKIVNPAQFKLKDKLNFFYKKLEVPINESDTHMGELITKHFGYKCQLYRDPNHPRLITELFVPCLRSKCSLKLLMKQYNPKIKMRKKLKTSKSKGSFDLKKMQV